MNILITLPINFINSILIGQKTIELRSVYPVNFDCKRDIVYVVAKGTNSIMLSFTVRAFVRYDDFLGFWLDCWHSIGVGYMWLERYAKNKRVLYAWEIDTVTHIIPHLDAKEHFNIKSNPQSFIYVR